MYRHGGLPRQGRVHLVGRRPAARRLQAAEYGKVILPLTVLRRLDCVLEPTKAEVLAEGTSCDAGRTENLEPHAAARRRAAVLQHLASSTSRQLLGDPDHIAANLRTYIAGFSPNARDVLDKFEFDDADRPARRGQPALPGRRQVRRHRPAPRRGVQRRHGLHLRGADPTFSEASNETAGEHFTPREVIRLMVNLLLHRGRRRPPPSPASSAPCTTRRAAPAACSRSPRTTCASSTRRPRLEVFGQELNPESYAICRSDMMIKGQDAGTHRLGNSFTEDGLPASSSTTCSPTRRSAWSGRRSRREIPSEHRDASATTGASGLGCRASTTARSCSCST